MQTYYDLLKKENKDRFKKQFKNWESTLTKNKVANIEALYKKVHAEIRKAPARPAAAKKTPVRKQITKKDGRLVQENSKKQKWLRHFKLTRAERAARVTAKIQKALQKK